MEIKYVEKISSTHNVLSELLRDEEIKTPYALYAGIQTGGIGSRGNSWDSQEGNLFLSFCLPVDTLPDDLSNLSTSIYFSWLILEFLRKNGSKSYLKWPNDFYINEKKIGGVITSKIKNFMLVSVGLNLKLSNNLYSKLDINISPCEFVTNFTKDLNFLPSWKHIFSKYKLEFSLSQNFSTHVDGKKVSLKEAKLLDDGSIEIGNKKVYSLR